MIKKLAIFIFLLSLGISTLNLLIACQTVKKDKSFKKDKPFKENKQVTLNKTIIEPTFFIAEDYDPEEKLSSFYVKFKSQNIKAISNESSYFKIYIGKNTTQKYLSFVFMYTGKQPIFFNEVKVLRKETNDLLSFPIKQLYKKVKVDRNSVLEYGRILFPNQLSVKELVSILKYSNEVKIRFQGEESYVDKIISKQYVKANLKLLEFYFSPYFPNIKNFEKNINKK